MAFRFNIDRITRFKVKLGVASGIDKEILRDALVEHIFPETIAEDAEVEVVLEPLIAKCAKCREEITHVAASGGCPACGSKDLDIIGGASVILEEIE